MFGKKILEKLIFNAHEITCKFCESFSRIYHLSFVAMARSPHDALVVEREGRGTFIQKYNEIYERSHTH